MSREVAKRLILWASIAGATATVGGFLLGAGKAVAAHAAEHGSLRSDLSAIHEQGATSAAKLDRIERQIVRILAIWQVDDEKEKP